MAVTLITTTVQYVGLATDQKPASAPAGSLFTESDTGRVFAFNGSAWINLSPYVADATQTGVLHAILDTLNAMRLVLENNLGQ